MTHMYHSICTLAVGFAFVTVGCTEPVPFLDDPDLLVSEPDLSVSRADMSERRDFSTGPADLSLVCGFGQTPTPGAGACSCDANHPVSCGEGKYCCAPGQACLPTPGPRGETRCSLPATASRSKHVFAYDKLRDESVVRFGVRDEIGVEALCTDQWHLTQVTWNAPVVTNPPAPRMDASLIWDDNAKGLLLWGGLLSLSDVNKATNDMWLWTGSAWTQKTPTGGPAARYAHAMAFDSVRKVAVLFGGEIGLVAQDDTWEWDNAQWILRTTTTTPSVRSDHRMVYDTKNRRIVMHGGFVSGIYSRETWTYDGANWTALPDEMSLPMRVKFGMAYDENRQVTVVFGGETLGGNVLGDTWEFDGLKWTKRAPVVSPPRRVSPAMTYDAGRKQVLLFGGDPIYLDRQKDLWAFDGTNWTQLY